MHPTIGYHLAQARIADLHHDAQRDALARAARGPGRRRRAGLRPWVLRRTRAVPGTAQAVQPAVAGEAPRPLSRHQVSGRRASGATEWPAPRTAAGDLRNENRKETTMAKTVTEARRPDATRSGADAIYRSLFDSFNPDQDGRISPLEVLSRLERSGLRADDPRIAEALTGLAGADSGSRQISFAQFKALAQHNSSLIRRAVEGNLAVPDFAALTADITRMYGELLPVRSGAVADYIPQLKRVDPDQLAIAVCTVDGQRFSVGDATHRVLPAVGVEDGELLPGPG